MMTTNNLIELANMLELLESQIQRTLIAINHLKLKYSAYGEEKRIVEFRKEEGTMSLIAGDYLEELMKYMEEVKPLVKDIPGDGEGE